jgi:molecular chaperone DnaK
MTRIPAVIEKVKNIFDKDPNRSVNPDEAVAVGAALQAAVLKGDVRDILLLDVTPLTVGLETLGRVYHPLIPRNSTIPTSKSEVFTTAEDNQNSVEIHVLQGERQMASDNKSIGRFILDGILPAPRGLPKVEVTFDLDANGILSVTAKDQATTRDQKIVIQRPGLSEEEIQTMVKEAEQHAEEDQRRLEEVGVRNGADQLTYNAEKLLQDNADKIPEELKIEVQEKVDALRTALQGEDIAQIRTLTSDLGGVLQRVGTHVYQESEASDSGPVGPEAGSSEDGEQEGDKGPSDPDDTVEGSFREVS